VAEAPEWKRLKRAVDFDNTKFLYGPYGYCLRFSPFFRVAVSPGQKIDYRDFAIDTCYPTANETHLAEERARSYWVKNAARFGPEPRFLAVETATIFSSEIQDLGIKLIHSQTTSSYYTARKNAVNPPEFAEFAGFGRIGTSWGSVRRKMGFRTVAIARGKDKEPLAKKLGAQNTAHDFCGLGRG
jgi:hypothetical protein